MKCVMKLPYENNAGNLIWMPPYLYPSNDLKNGIEELIKKEYRVSLFTEGDGITFTHENLPSEAYNDFCAAFSWMNITLYAKEKEFDYEEDILKYQLIILPVSRLEISESIINGNICLFPAGHFQIEKIALKNLAGNKFEGGETNKLRDSITNITEVDINVFKLLPVIVFKDEIKFDEYLRLTHQQDEELIRDFSDRADKLLDLMRFYRCDYNIPDQLPAKPGIWHDRYSAALIYFPKCQSGFIQAREVELKTFCKGIGMDFFDTDLLSIHPLLLDELSEVGNIAKHALRLNTLIAESDNLTMKFMQLMILFEYLGNPYEYEKFEKLKGKLIACIANEQTGYNNLSARFLYFSKFLRTEIIHNGKRIEELMPISNERKALFKELQGFVYSLIHDLFLNSDLTWAQYDETRRERQKNIIN